MGLIRPLMSLFLLFPFQECPSGLVDEETFKTIYSQFFPQGGKKRTSLKKILTYLKQRFIYIIYIFRAPYLTCVFTFLSFPFLDATTYAHFLFNAFDLDRNGSIRFEVSTTQVKMA